MTSTALLPVPVQGSFDELGTPLRDTTFVVVDLETTGSAADRCEITEIGAVKVRRGEVLGEFQTLVRPQSAIPPFIAVLTGISDSTVAGAPPASAAVPAFLEFARGCVLVAHNAPFDIGFLRAACARLGLDWPSFDVVDTARLARRVVTRDETPDCKLSSLARLFRSGTTPVHRALADARATVDVLHGLLERVGPLGVQTLEELRTFSSLVSAAQRRKRHLAEGLPHAPGVYQFLDGQGRVLYVGRSRDLHRRVRTYFTSSETRTRMAEMVGLAERVVPVVCATDLEAQVRELRLIGEHEPRYNRRSRFPERSVFVKLTVEPFPRLSVVRAVRADGATYLGPFSSARAADLAVAAVHDAIPLRQCRGRLPLHPTGSACALAEMGRCGAPCEGRETVEQYGRHVTAVRQAAEVDAGPLVAAVTGRLDRLAAEGRYEEAAARRDRLTAFVRAAGRLQRLVALTRCPQLVAARPTDDLGYELVAVRHGRFSGTALVPRGAHPQPYLEALLATAEPVRPGPGPLPAAGVEETECLLRWLESDGVRLVALDGEWSSPVRGATSLRSWLDATTRPLDALDDRRRLRPVARPARWHEGGVPDPRPATTTGAQ